MALCEVRLGKLKAPSCNLYCSSSYTKRNRIGTSGEAAWCPPNFEMIGLAMAMKMQTKRHLLSSRCVSFKNTFLASPRSPPFFEDKSPASIHSLFQQGNGTNNNPKRQAKKNTRCCWHTEGGEWTCSQIHANTPAPHRWLPSIRSQHGDATVLHDHR